MAEKPGNPFEAAKKDVSNALIIEKTSKKSKFKVPSLVKAVGLAAGLHGAAYVAPDIAERVEQYQEEVRAEENRERIERNREAAVRRALAEIEADDLNFWKFIRDTDRADMEAAGIPVPSAEEVERNFRAVADRIIAEQQGYFEVHTDEDRAYLQETLRLAFEEYYYTAGMGESDIQTFFHDRGGPCGMISLAVVSALDRAGYEGLGVRYYPAGETGPGHVAPSLRYTDSVGVEHEIDLVGGGSVAPGGVTLPLEEVVRLYAGQYDLLPEEGVSEETPSGVVGSPRGWGISIHFPPDARPFGGDVPLFAEGIIGAYHTNEEGQIVDERGEVVEDVSGHEETGFEQTIDEWQETHEFEDDSQDFLARLYDRHVTHAPPASPEEADFDVRIGLSDRELARLSETITWSERRLRRSEHPDATLFETLRLVGLYRLAAREAALLRRTQIHEVAELNADRYAQEAEALLEPHLNDGRFLNLYLTGGISRDSTTSALALGSLGEMGGRALLNLYDDYTRQYGNELFGNKANVLTAAILNETSRADALERANQLSIRDQFKLIGLSFAQSAFREGENGREGLLMDGDDALSRNNRAFQALFDTLDFTASVTGGRFLHDGREVVRGLSSIDEFEELPGREFRSLEQAFEYVERYARSHGFDQDWIEVVRENLVFEIISLMSSMPAQQILRREAFFSEVLSWSREHGHETDVYLITDRLRRAREEMAHSP